MKITKLVVGELLENCYILEKNNNALIIDPGDEGEKILKYIENKNLNLVGILVTHAHLDHIGALDFILEKYNVKAYYNNINNELSKNIINIKEGKYEILNFKFSVIETIGHRNDLVTFYFYDDNVMFTGDFLFHLLVGRTDLKYGDFFEMQKSIEKIKEYDDNIVIYPGHGEKTTLGFEKKNNLFFI